jgi:CheY-like chemotaxis protein
VDRLAASYDRESMTFVGATILLVDDDADVREVTAAMLREAGYDVVEAGSGGAGLEALDRTERVELMLVDFAMPGMNGAEVAREALIRRPGLPILFVTGYADLEAIRSVGEDRIIAKPFQFDRLLQAIDHALGAKPDPGANVVRLRR